MAQMYLFILLIPLLTTALSAEVINTLIANPEVKICPSAPRRGTFGRVRIPLDHTLSPKLPWTKPFTRQCLSWIGQEASTLSAEQRIERAVCDTFTVDRVSKYYVVISTNEVHLNVQDTINATLFRMNPRAIVRLFGATGSFLQRTLYTGDHFQTNDVLIPGTVYRICVSGLGQNFTMCTINLMACNSSNPMDCGIPGKGKVAKYFRHARRFSERIC